MSDIQIVENFFPPIIFKEVVFKVNHSAARWSFKEKNPTQSEDYKVFTAQQNDPKIVEDISYFQYKFYGDGLESNDDRIAEIFQKYISAKFGYNVKEILRINCNIAAPCSTFQPEQYTMPHVDVNIPHRSLVFYLHDSDGDTVLFDRFSESGEENIQNLQEVKRVKPKKNMCVTFNGLRLHSACPSTTMLRKIINVNYL